MARMTDAGLSFPRALRQALGGLRLPRVEMTIVNRAQWWKLQMACDGGPSVSQTDPLPGVFARYSRDCTRAMSEIRNSARDLISG